MKDTSQFNKDFIKNYNEESDEEYFHEAEIQEVKKLVANLNDKAEYVIHTYQI